MQPGDAPEEVATQPLSSTSTPAPRAAVLPEGTSRLGRFQLVRALGAGGSGAVFEAIDTASGQRVALKILRGSRPSALKREFRALADIAHPNLVAMHELFIDRQRAFFSMDLLEGRSFLEYVRSGGERCDVARLRACLPQLARGVMCLHAHGKLHCDLKPSNVLVSESGQLTIVDFGLVQSAGELREFTGTPAYAAPEQRGERGASAASDWYAVGVMLYEAIEGRRPFPGNALEVLAQKAAEDPPPLRDSPCAALARLCLQLLQRDPAKRGDGRAVLAELGAAAELPEPDAHTLYAGRERELDALERAWTDVCAGQSRAIVIAGESGMGKTTLAQQFLLRRNDARVFEGRCLMHEALPYNALDGVFEVIGRHRLPALGEAHSPQEGRTQAFYGLRQLMAAMSARTPLILFIDDLQWADADSVQLLRALLAPPLPRLLLLATYRPGDDRARELLPRFERLELGPLGETDLQRLAERWLPACSEALVREIADKSEGHPLLACELFRFARLGPAEPLELNSALGARLASLSAAARRALRLVCCAGQRLPRRLLHVGRRPIHPAALRELRLARAVRETVWADEPCVEPYHDSIRDYVTRTLTAASRRRLHRWLAIQLQVLGPRYLERALQHHLLAGDERAAAGLAERAAEHAGDALALHAAADLLALALRHAGPQNRARLRLLAADACLRAGRAFEAAEHYERAARSAAPADRAELQLRALSAFYVSGHEQRGRALLEALAREWAIPIRLPLLSAPGALARFVASRWVDRPRLRSARTHGIERERLSLLWNITLALVGIDGASACHFAAQALVLAARLGDRAVYGQALAFHLALHAFTFGGSRRLERRFERARQLAQSDGEVWDDAYVRVARAGSAVMDFEHARALESCLDVAKLPSLRTPASACVRSAARMVSLVALYWSGRIAELSELSARWLDEAIHAGDRRLEFAWRTMQCYAHLRVGDVAAALREIERARALGLDYVQGAGADPWWVANVALYAGDAVAAAAACDAQRPHYGLYARYSSSMRAQWAWTDGLCAAALVARGIDRHAQLVRLETCVRALARSRFPAAKPAALQLTAALAVARGERRGAERALEAAIAGYEARGIALHAAASRLALARVATAGGAALERAGLEAFEAQGIVRVERWANMLAPGFGVGASDHDHERDVLALLARESGRAGVAGFQ